VARLGRPYIKRDGIAPPTAEIAVVPLGAWGGYMFESIQLRLYDSLRLGVRLWGGFFGSTYPSKTLPRSELLHSGDFLSGRVGPHFI